MDHEGRCMLISRWILHLVSMRYGYLTTITTTRKSPRILSVHHEFPLPVEIIVLEQLSKARVEKVLKLIVQFFLLRRLHPMQVTSTESCFHASSIRLTLMQVISIHSGLMQVALYFLLFFNSRAAARSFSSSCSSFSSQPALTTLRFGTLGLVRVEVGGWVGFGWVIPGIW